MTNPPEPLAAPAASGIPCAASGCPDPIAVQWRRRLTDTEWQDVLAADQQRRDEILALADPAAGPPDLGPTPDRDCYTRTVYACGRHALHLDLAAHIHQCSCAAPDPAALPGCACTPEPLPAATDPGTPTITLPTGWTIPSPA